ncbi:FHA domain-containing protein [Pseudomarimonas salicorniae]|uniref:FHA domain-containing protein n=1 Tax=Pseudomarimonas salicorniae TaxID=2933270 RepID=A0ABT0GLH2_9GAMM|nr:FHA domain-containing protein [Lysobacter sp. CAU 1642]MCK7594897.1 FHA domain-containing protein [Lysobacter sp. CAU 1642]
MRISFPNGEHTDVALEGGELTLGAAAGNDIVLPVEGVLPRHAIISIDPQRGILLHVAAAGAQVHVNGRQVLEFALLRLGDVLSLGRAQLLLKPERDQSIVVRVPDQSAPESADPAARAASSRVVLRGVAGGFYGRSISLQSRVVVGRGKDAGIRIDDAEIPDQALSFEVHGDRVVLRDLGTQDGVVVNGVPVRNAILHPGDQIALDVHRFVLEAPGLPARGAATDDEPIQPGANAGSTQTLRAVRAESPAPQSPSDAEASGGGRFGWLLLAASLLAAALAALFLLGPR